MLEELSKEEFKEKLRNDTDNQLLVGINEKITFEICASLIATEINEGLRMINRRAQRHGLGKKQNNDQINNKWLLLNLKKE